MDKIKRKSQKKKRVNVSSGVQNGLFILFFQVENTNLKFCLGCHSLSFFDTPINISIKIVEILRSFNCNFTYCLEKDIERELIKMEKRDD